LLKFPTKFWAVSIFLSADRFVKRANLLFYICPMRSTGGGYVWFNCAVITGIEGAAAETARGDMGLFY
jgi:hypothetical protein